MLPDRSMTKKRFGESVVMSRNMLPQRPCASGEGAAVSSTQPSLGGGVMPVSATWVPASNLSAMFGGNSRLEHDRSASAARKHDEGRTAPRGYPNTSLASAPTPASTA
jgi:hypothetical protein